MPDAGEQVAAGAGIPAGLPRFAPSSALRGKEGLPLNTVFEGLDAIQVDYQDYH